MKKTILLLTFVAILSSCNSGRIAELEAENIELKATVERLIDEARIAQLQAERAQAMAVDAQRLAELYAARAIEEAKNAEK